LVEGRNYCDKRRVYTLMLLLVGLALTSSVTLDQVYAKVKTLPGVEIAAEMVRPSSVAITFRIAPGGFFWAKYPTTEDFITPKERVSWMPDRRQYARSKPEEGNPLPSGFEALWPGEGVALTPKGVGKETTFAGRNAFEIPCVAREGHPVRLFVERLSLMPLGSIATANGRDYEMQYKSVKVRAISPASLTFTPPADAKAFTGGPPDAKLIKPGAKPSPFKVTDMDGKSVSSTALTKGQRGLVLNFWFSACTGCVEEMPFLKKLERSLRSQRIPLLGINPIDPKENALKTLKTNGLTFRGVVGASAKSLAQTFGVEAYPVTIIFDDKGEVIDAIMGFNEARLMAALRKIGYVAE
jgi:thiol-disulfide isomerase/thioredoxin